MKPKLSDLNPEESGKNRFPPQADNPDKEIVAFHLTHSVKSNNFFISDVSGQAVSENRSVWVLDKNQNMNPGINSTIPPFALSF